MTQEWYFTAGGQQAGPVDWPYLQQLIAAGQIAQSAMVWCEGMPQWVPVAAVPGLSVGAAAPTTAPQTTAAPPVLDYANLGGTAAAFPIPSNQAYGMADPYLVAQNDSTLFAGFWLRWFASLIDGILCAIIAIPVLGLIVWSLGVSDPSDPTGSFNLALTLEAYPLLEPLLMLFAGGIGWLYFALLESSTWQATVGKRALGLVVTGTDGKRISFGRATGRHFGKILSQMIFYLGYIMAGVTERKQALHDMLASCLVMIKNE